MTPSDLARRFAAWLLASTAALLALSLATRDIAPIDETRYVAVAWHMWHRGDFVLPWLAGAPYSHKPPMLFWLMHAGWAVFGVNAWWPRLLSPLAAVAAVALTWRLARRLWPDDAGVGERAGVVLAGTLLWVLFGTAVMFDVVLTVLVLAGAHGLLSAAQGRAGAGWGLVALAVGGGLLAKGPIVLLHVLPLALLVRWWAPAARPPAGRWALGLLAALGLGAAIALAWAVPAGLRGGEAYRGLIFWGQTGGRIVHAFDHARAWWWYLPLLPLVTFPWLAWPTAWRALRALAAGGPDTGMRFVGAWVGTVFVALCLISGKQPHYLLPLLPAGAMLLARGLGRVPAARRADLWPAGLAMVAVGVAKLGAGAWPLPPGAAHWLADLPAWAGGTAVLAGLALLLARRMPTPAAPPWRLAGATMVTLAAVQAGVFQGAGLAYDSRAAGQRLGALQRDGVPLALVGMPDEGSFDFHGRLRQPLTPVRVADLGAWFEAHPGGVAAWRLQLERDDVMPPALLRQPWRGRWLVLVDASQWRAWAAR